ncbi:MAG TPA: lysyl oxidase family protein [Anaerolineae bacterium]
MGNENDSVSHRNGRRPLLLLLILFSLLVALASCQQMPDEDAAATPTRRPDAAATATTAAGESTRPPAQVTTATATATRESRPTATATASVNSEGALIEVTFDSQVGVLLDEVPEEMRSGVAADLADQSDAFWVELAQRQVRLTLYRLILRTFKYSGKGPLPLPPEELWLIELDEAGPSRQTVQDHDLMLIGYTFSSTLLTDVESPAQSEPALVEAGGVWEEPFVLPLDPDLLLQRTGNACINEAGFPPNSFDSENAWRFYDHTCTADSGGPGGCHRSQLPTLDCVEAVTQAMGALQTSVRFERLAWDTDLADEVRTGEITQLAAADLKVVGDDLNNHRIVYRYFPTESCALLEQCVGASGWRRLLLFDATVHNVGSQPLHIGPVIEDPRYTLFKYNACHNHYHYNNYGEFLLDDADQASKQAFCVQSTGRASNNETSPLTHPYSCRFQGIQTGWIDEYFAGLDCQWIDISDIGASDEITGTAALTETLNLPLTFRSNPDRFLCEGTPVLDEEGNLLWERIGVDPDTGIAMDRPQCDFVEDWDVNNEASVDVTIAPTGSFVTEPCQEDVLGPLRNCGFTEQEIDLTCTPGSTVQLSCSVDDDAPPQVLRVCETSAVLGVATACTLQDALANTIIGPSSTEVTFNCPFARDAEEPGGAYALYTAPIYGEDEPVAVSCTTVQP